MICLILYIAFSVSCSRLPSSYMEVENGFSNKIFNGEISASSLGGHPTPVSRWIKNLRHKNTLPGVCCLLLGGLLTAIKYNVELEYAQCFESRLLDIVEASSSVLYYDDTAHSIILDSDYADEPWEIKPLTKDGGDDSYAQYMPVLQGSHMSNYVYSELDKYWHMPALQTEKNSLYDISNIETHYKAPGTISTITNYTKPQDLVKHMFTSNNISLSLETNEPAMIFNYIWNRNLSNVFALDKDRLQIKFIYKMADPEYCYHLYSNYSNYSLEQNLSLLHNCYKGGTIPISYILAQEKCIYGYKQANIKIPKPSWCTCATIIAIVWFVDYLRYPLMVCCCGCIWLCCCACFGPRCNRRRYVNIADSEAWAHEVQMVQINNEEADSYAE